MPDAKEVLEHLENKPKFKVGDRVVSKHFGKGTVTAIVKKTSFPIEVHFDHTSAPPADNRKQCFTSEGEYFANSFEYKLWEAYPENLDIKLLTAEEPTETQPVHEEPKFNAGDDVYCDYFGNGIVRRKVKVEATVNEKEQPVKYWLAIKFDSRQHEYMYSEDGKTSNVYLDPKSDLEKSFILHHGKTDKEPICMTECINAINPSHYRAEGIPEAIDIMRGLMTDEQLEGFLWGNIIKYAYRYGRKGDKKETAEKIKWYAEKLAMLNTKELKI